MDNTSTCTSQQASLKTEIHSLSNHDMLGYLLYLEHEKEYEKQRLASQSQTPALKKSA